MIIDTHTHVVSSNKAKHPLDPGARGWSTEVSNDVEDLIKEMDDAGVECATLVQPNATYGLDNIYQCDSAKLYSPRTVSVGILDPAASDAAEKLSYWVNEHGMNGVRLQSQAEPDDPSCDAIWERAEALGEGGGEVGAALVEGLEQRRVVLHRRRAQRRGARAGAAAARRGGPRTQPCAAH